VTPRVVFRPEARRELFEARRWYEERIAGLGLEFARAVEGAIDPIRAHPQSFRQVHGEHRRCLVRRFPYSVVLSSDQYRNRGYCRAASSPGAFLMARGAPPNKRLKLAARID